MSKKSRKRNKKILAAIGIGLGAAALASRKKTGSENKAYLKTEGGDTSKITPKKKPDSKMPDNLSKDTGKDNKIAPKNQKSIIVKKNTNEVFKRKDGPGSSEVGNPKSNFKGEDGYIRRGENATPMTGGRFGTSRAASEMSKGALPPQLRAPKKPETYNEISPFAAKNGGRANYKSGGSARGCGKALRGYGKAMKGKK